MGGWAGTKLVLASDVIWVAFCHSGFPFPPRTLMAPPVRVAPATRTASTSTLTASVMAAVRI